MHLKYALWENQIGTKNSIGTSPFRMVYGTDVVLPINLALPVTKLWQDEKEEPNPVTRRINQLIEVQQHRAEVDERLQKYQDDMKMLFDRKSKDKDFSPKRFVFKMGCKEGRPDKTW